MYLISSMIWLVGISMLVKHPFFLAQMLLGMSLLSGWGLWNLSSVWVFISVMMIFLGGVMVTILYLTSLANNEKTREGVLVKLSMGGPLLLVPEIPMLTEICITDFFKTPQISLFLVILGYMMMVLMFIVKLARSWEGAVKKF